MKRLNLIVVSCGESYITLEEWACTASPVYIRVIYILLLSGKILVQVKNNRRIENESL